MSVLNGSFPLFIFLLTLLPNASAVASQRIEWEIVNRFRAFDYMGSEGAEDRAEGERLFEVYRPTANETSIQDWMIRLARLGSPYDASKSGPWMESSFASTPGYKKGFVELPNKVQVRARLVNTDISIKPDAQCVWSVDGEPQAARPCSNAVRLEASKAGSQLKVEVAGAPPSMVDVLPKLKIIVGIGDSYAAGQGSPDRPTVWKTPTHNRAWNALSRSEIDTLVKVPAVWVSPRCNRSFWSYQNLTALRIAADDPHSIVSFVHLACAGAEVVDGLLAPQRMAPGHPRQGCKRNVEQSSPDVRCDVPYSQLKAAADLLCKVQTHRLGNAAIDEIVKPLKNAPYAKDELHWINDLSACPAGELRPVELVMVGIGGNDMGFFGVILWGLAPIKSHHPLYAPLLDRLYTTFRSKTGVVCPRSGSYGGPMDVCKNSSTAEDRMAQLPLRFDALRMALDSILGVSGPQIALTQYPNPLSSSTGLCSNPPYSDVENEWNAAYVGVPFPFSLFRTKNPLNINLTPYEAGEVNSHVVQKLAATMNDYAVNWNWKTASSVAAMRSRGWCTGDHRHLITPKLAHTWDPLRDETRRIRTLNDTFLTQWPGTLDRDDGLSGAFHPNLQGYAAIADALMRAVRAPQP